MTSFLRRLPTRREFLEVIASLSKNQKIVLGLISLVFLGSLFGLIWKINEYFLIEVAVPGGSLTEGIVGFPTHANPLLAISDADRDLVALVYSGLMKINNQGVLVPDLAKNYEVSDDGLTYTFTLKDNLTWHDGSPLTTDDIEFTIAKAQDQNVKSPRRAAWDGVQVEKLSPTVIRFTLKKAYAGFLDNCTLKILPKHIWQNIKPETFLLSEYNITGIGSGPYKIVTVTRDQAGMPTIYHLTAFKNYANGEPKITDLYLHFYSNDEEVEAAYEKGEIESYGAVPPEIATDLKTFGAKVNEISLPRSFAVFFNQNQTIFNDKSVRLALSLATDKQALVDQVLKGAGTPIDNPVPPGSVGYVKEALAKVDLERAEAVLVKNGWKKGDDGVWKKSDKKTTTRLEFTLATASTPELKQTAELLAAQWGKLGAKVNVAVYDLSDLDQNLIRPRKFEALLFGEVVGRDSDLYSFWHSSQRLAPGLNVAQYTNITADKLLESARQSSDQETRAKQYEKFQTLLANDIPAIFLYSPYYLYILPSKVNGASFPSLVTPAERFSGIATWYINKNRVWKIFATDK